MKAKILATSVLWATLLIATAILLRRTPHFGPMFTLLVLCSAANIGILARPARPCPR